MQMWEHLLQYIDENTEDVQELLSDVLKKRGMNFCEYIDKMRNNLSCGYEATLLIMSHMFKMKILVIRSDFLWVSVNVEPSECDVVLIQNGVGFFYGTKCKKKFHVGDVPKFESPKKKKPHGLSTVETARLSLNHK